MAAFHDRRGQSPMFAPILQVKLPHIGVDVRKVIADLGDQNHAALLPHDMVVHDDKQQQRPAEHAGKELRHRFAFQIGLGIRIPVDFH